MSMNETKELTPEQKTRIQELHNKVVDQLVEISVNLIKFRNADEDSEVDNLTKQIVVGVEGYANLRIEMDRVLRGAA